MLSRKQYKFIADIMGGAMQTCEEVGDEATIEFMTECVIKPMALIFKLDNPSFDAVRFVSACGVKEES